MKIINKIALNNTIATVLIIILAGTLVGVGKKTINLYNDFYETNYIPLDKLRRIQLIYREIEFMFPAVSLDYMIPLNAAENIQNSIVVVDKLWKEVEDVIPAQENKIEREIFTRGHNMFKELAKELVPKLQKNDLKGMNAYFEKWNECKILIVKPIDMYIEDQARDLNENYSSYTKFLTRLIIGITISAAGIVLLFIMLSLWILRSIKKPLNDVTGILNDLAAGEGNLTIPVFHKKVNCSELRKCGHKECPKFATENNDCMIEVGSYALQYGNEIKCPTILSGKLKSCHDCTVVRHLVKDEVDDLSFTLDRFIRKIKDMIINIKEVSLALSSSANELSHQAESFSVNAQSQAASTEEVSASMDLVKEGQETAGDTIVLFNELMTHIVAKLGKSMESAANSGMKMKDALSTKNILDGILKNVQSTNLEMTTRMDEARDVAQRTKDIIQSVTNISEQINLLSLNAAIEAARAGDQGRGFAVVADEIGKLSDLTQENVKGITDKIENTSKVINMVNSNINVVVDNVKTVIDEITKFGMIVEEISTMLVLDNNIKHGIQSDAKTMFDCSGLITNSIMDNKVAVMEIAKAMHNINEVIQQNSAGTEEMSANTEETANMAEKLKGYVEQFKVQ